MARRKRMDTAGKVRELHSLLGSWRVVGEVMGAGSATSFKRWKKRECNPLRAHVRLVDETHAMARRMSKALLSKLHRDYARN